MKKKANYTLGDYTVAPAATFHLPSDVFRKGVVKGFDVKLVFTEPINGSERMWVKIKKNDHGSFKGVLINHPLCLESIKFLDSVSFKWNHIIDIAEGKKPHKKKV